jgi:peptidyl-prolyl cis-trans isomerase C
VFPEEVRSTGVDATNVLVTVNGDSLTEGDANFEVETRLAAFRSQIPPERLESLREQMRNRVVQDYVAKSLLLAEAREQDITVTPEDEEASFERIRRALPEGTTLEDVLKKGPISEEKMMKDIRDGILIRKLLTGRMDADMEVTDAEITAFMEENEERVAVPETVKARHILLGVDQEDDEKAKGVRRAEAEVIRQQLLDGADFAELAREKSDCPSSKSGGDLGTFRRGQMVGPFDEAAFSQATNVIGPVVETKFGYHVIQVLEHSPAGTVPREKVAEMLENKKREESVTGYIEELKAAADITYPSQPEEPAPEEAPEEALEEALEE